MMEEEDCCASMEDFNLSYATNFSLKFTLSDSVFDTLYHRNYVVIGLYVPLFLVALSANAIVVAVVIKYHYMRSVTNYFLVNLSVADLLVTIVCIPNGAWQAYSHIWYFGDIACRVGKYMQCVAVASSVFTISAMAIDRYLAIAQPFGLAKCFYFNKKTAVLIILFIWFASLVIFLPILIVCQVKTEVILQIQLSFCYENWDDIEYYYPRQVFGIVCFVVMFALPGFLILWAYALMGKKLCSGRPPFDNNEGSISTQQGFRLVRERKRVAWILLLLAFVFAICWLPYNLIYLVLDTTGIGIDPEYAQYMLLLAHANSALNPIIYCIMSRNFRRSVKELITMKQVEQYSKRDHRVKYPDTSGSSQRLNLKKIDPPTINNQMQHTVSRLQSSQKTTKTCAV